jgi:2,3-bisphosphoglycerate-dependent phosphoglycerate mutase
MNQLVDSADAGRHAAWRSEPPSRITTAASEGGHYTRAVQQPVPGLERLGRLDVLLVRHAEPEPVGHPDYAEDERPLTDAGRNAANELAEQFDAVTLSAVYSSPYTRAVETVKPTADRHSLEVLILTDLRERRLTMTSLPNWREHLELAWQDHEYALEGAESGSAAQRRALGVLNLLRVRHPDGGRLLVGSHGNLISLILHALEPTVGFDFHLAMPMPALYWLEHDGLRWRLMAGHGVDRLASASG